MRIKLCGKDGNEKVFNTESNDFLSALKEIYLSCDTEIKERFFKSVTSDDMETTIADSMDNTKNFFKVESFNDLDLFSIKIGTGVIVCKAKIISGKTMETNLFDDRYLKAALNFQEYVTSKGLFCLIYPEYRTIRGQETKFHYMEFSDVLQEVFEFWTFEHNVKFYDR